MKTDAASNKAAKAKPVSFMHDVAPVLVRNCIACHNPKKSESKYVMTTFAQLAKGGKQGEGMTLVPGKPDESYLLDVVLPDAEPRMPYKLDPLPTTRSRSWRPGFPGGRSTTAPARRRLDVPAPQDPGGHHPRGLPGHRSGHCSRPSARTATRLRHRVIMSSRSGRSPTAALARRIRGLAERIYGIRYSADGKWLATASGDPGQFGVATLWTAEPGRYRRAGS